MIDYISAPIRGVRKPTGEPIFTITFPDADIKLYDTGKRKKALIALRFLHGNCYAELDTKEYIWHFLNYIIEGEEVQKTDGLPIGK